MVHVHTLLKLKFSKGVLQADGEWQADRTEDNTGESRGVNDGRKAAVHASRNVASDRWRFLSSDEHGRALR